MDLRLAWQVIWRFKILVALGLTLATVSAFLSMVSVNLSGSPHFAYKTQPSYESLTTVFVTSHGFPYGSLKLRAGSKAHDAPPGSRRHGPVARLCDHLPSVRAERCGRSA